MLVLYQLFLTSILNIYMCFALIMLSKVNEGASVSKGLVTADNTYKDEMRGSLMVQEC